MNNSSAGRDESIRDDEVLSAGLSSRLEGVPTANGRSEMECGCSPAAAYANVSAACGKLLG